MKIKVNGELRTVRSEPDTPLLWVLRDELELKGTKLGCGIGECGCCNVLLDGEPLPSCALLVGEVEGEVTTIEGLGTPARPHPVQTAWLEENVVQCGYCQPGQMLSAAALIASNPRPDRAAIDAAMSGNLCRCGTYPRIRRAVHRAAELVRVSGASRPADEVR
jgi:isoquinoline 1-oxidoreductase alpha subunit